MSHIDNDIDDSLIADGSEIQIVHVFQHIDPSKMMLEGVDLSRLPGLRTKQVANIFFQKSAGWLRWRDREGQFSTPDGSMFCDPARDDKGTRLYSLADIELLAHVFAQQGIIDGMHLEITLHLIRLMAIGYGVTVT